MSTQGKGPWWGWIYLAGFVAVAAAGGIVFLGTHTVAGVIAWIVLVLGALLLLVGWHARTYAYRCPNCAQEFEISLWTDLISPHGWGKRGGWKYLCCPHCGRRARATVVPKGTR